MARTDARTTLGLDEALRRADAYAKAGADILFVESPESLEEMRTIGRSFDRPLMANMVEGGRTPYLSEIETRDNGLHDRDFSRLGLPGGGRRPQACLGNLRTAGTGTGSAAPMLPFADMNTLMGFPAVHAFSKSVMVWPTTTRTSRQPNPKNRTLNRGHPSTKKEMRHGKGESACENWPYRGLGSFCHGLESAGRPGRNHHGYPLGRTILRRALCRRHGEGHFQEERRGCHGYPDSSRRRHCGPEHVGGRHSIRRGFAGGSGPGHQFRPKAHYYRRRRANRVRPDVGGQEGFGSQGHQGSGWRTRSPIPRRDR